MFDSSQHPLYRAAGILLARGMSHRQLLRLRRLFEKHELPPPLDLNAALTAAGVPITL